MFRFFTKPGFNARPFIKANLCTRFTSCILRSYSVNHAPPSTLEKTKSFFKYAAFFATTGFFIIYLQDSRAGFHKVVTMPLVRALTDPEEAHKMAIKIARWGIVPVDKKTDDVCLKTELWGKQLSNPVGLAAGFDKHGEAIDSMLSMGFGSVEIGSVTPKSQPGNPKPRMFRLPDDNAVINRYGFNSDGHKVVLERLKQRVRRYIYRHKPIASSDNTSFSSSHLSAYLSSDTNRSLHPERCLGVNLGKNKSSLPDSHSDYVQGVQLFLPYADYLVVNISSPNTPGLRSLQRKEVFYGLVRDVMDARNDAMVKEIQDTGNSRFVPLVIKIAPDLTEDEIKDIADVALDCKVDGIIVSNTTIQRPTTLRSDASLTTQLGGLSGPPVKQFSLAAVRTLYKYSGGRIPIIGCGGISSAADAIEYAKSGASFIQLYTSLAMDGPSVVADIKDGLTDYLKKEGKTWSQLVGSGME
ncbi:Dihydroorotate dehydrogenase-domain-containing protein [Paraphysoderma sedebokerense]|nr:Dihydroorotate dehydrogenase-domain-containing protein [Paraphysoderma sedebokerense]